MVIFPHLFSYLVDIFENYISFLLSLPFFYHSIFYLDMDIKSVLNKNLFFCYLFRLTNSVHLFSSWSIKYHIEGLQLQIYFYLPTKYYLENDSFLFSFLKKCLRLFLVRNCYTIEVVWLSINQKFFVIQVHKLVF